MIILRVLLLRLMMITMLRLNLLMADQFRIIRPLWRGLVSLLSGYLRICQAFFHPDTMVNRFGCIPREAFGSRMDGFWNYYGTS